MVLLEFTVIDVVESWPENGGCRQSSAVAGTTSVCPISAIDGPSPVPGMRAIRFDRSGSRATSSQATPFASR
jgi:hypothetical protein